MSRILIVAPVLMIFSGSLVACNSANSSSVTSHPSTQSRQNGMSCASSIEEFKAIMASDRTMGHVAERVYSRVMTELDTASAACAAGRDSDARRILATTKARHGYP